ncbi:hypothetical protein EST38_g7975 [Candolleomyces aberdarensis]|uniref:Uncharacterized protein n=1 Tax=Candolleomyces aberdarensis TaxID=2316362 RepID=A0A4Q2DFK1_9AGAR|nr:hypothetical protein EST38_g7975 [Candolleomyces aberdarensis]
MQSNIDLALSQILSGQTMTTSSCDEIHVKVFIDAYMQISGISDVVQAYTCFERALGKYPDPAEKAGSKEAQQRARLVAQARMGFWKEVRLKVESGSKSHLQFKRLLACPCCGELMSASQMIKALGLDGTAKKARGSNDTSMTPVKKRAGKAKKRGQHRKREDGRSRKRAFDLYGASTSKCSI